MPRIEDWARTIGSSGQIEQYCRRTNGAYPGFGRGRFRVGTGNAGSANALSLVVKVISAHGTVVITVITNVFWSAAFQTAMEYDLYKSLADRISFKLLQRARLILPLVLYRWLALLNSSLERMAVDERSFENKDVISAVKMNLVRISSIPTDISDDREGNQR